VRLLLRHHQRTGDADALRMATLTLEKMAAGGLYDQLGGGFHRYSTDAEWLLPHFEKMLYDNALLVVAYAEAFQVTGRADFARVAHETCDYVLREMTDAGGGFYSATDADSEGEEGRFFVWREDEIRRELDALDNGDTTNVSSPTMTCTRAATGKVTPSSTSHVPMKPPGQRWPRAGQALRSARQAHAALARRQDPRRLERPDDLGPGGRRTDSRRSRATSPRRCARPISCSPTCAVPTADSGAASRTGRHGTRPSSTTTPASPPA
jgi:uncharacterized protein YyaL (SSP411 family)